MPVTYRNATAADLPGVVAVEGAAFSVPWSEASFRSLLPLERVHFVVAEDEGAVVGHGILWWVADEGELANLAVAPGHRRRGVAGRLLDLLLDRARASGLQRVVLEVRVSNHAARALYASRGFQEVGLRRNYYRRPVEDARVLALELRLPRGRQSPGSPSSQLQPSGETP